MHECVKCGSTCYCDLNNSTFEDPPISCFHECQDDWADDDDDYFVGEDGDS